MSKIAVYPGSFDPITNGHVDIIERISKVFDKVIVLVAQSSDKKYLFTVDERKRFIQEVFKTKSNVIVDSFSGLTVEYMKKQNAQVIIRGMRAVADFEYEGTLSSMNKMLAPEIETFMIFSRPELYYISSRAVKEVARNFGVLDDLVPELVKNELIKKYQR